MTRLASIAALMLCSVSALALEPGQRIANFKLTDLDGKPQELYQFADRKAVVIMIQGNGCPIVRLGIHAFREVRDQYRDRGAEFFLINSNLQDTAETVRAEAKEFGFGLPIWLDSKQNVGEALGVTRTAEVFVFDPKTWKLMYHGPVDDRLSYEKQRPVQHHYLADAVGAVIAGKPVAKPYVNAPGCLINFPNRSQVR
jgi:peroxiredoxin